MTITLRDAAGEQVLNRATAPEVLKVGEKFYLRMSVGEQRAVYKETDPEEL